MFKKILVPTDGSALAEKAVAPAIAFAREIGASMVAVAVGEQAGGLTFWDGTGVVPDIQAAEERVRVRTQDLVDRVASQARAANVPCETLAVLGADPSREIISAAKAHQCDIVFMASHGRGGFNSLLLGSVTQKVLAHSTIPVLIYR
ncbi:MAG: universal stress protein [Noviherbaspirillum sp.]